MRKRGTYSQEELNWYEASSLGKIYVSSEVNVLDQRSGRNDRMESWYDRKAVQ